MKTVLICSGNFITPLVVEHARAAAMRAHRLVATGWGISVCKNDELADDIIQTCKTYSIPCQVVGSIKAGLNGADKVVSFGRPEVVSRASRLGIQSWSNRLAIPVQMALPI